MAFDPSVAQRLADLKEKIEKGTAVAQTLTVGTSGLAVTTPGASSTDDKQAKLEAWLLEKNERQAKLAHQKEMDELAAKDLEQDIAHRRELTDKILVMTQRWLIFVGSIVFVSGYTDLVLNEFRFTWHLPENVILGLIGTTTVTVIGLFATVTRYFFFRRGGSDSG